MTVEKILKRFMKECGIYGTKASKEIIEFSKDFDEVFIPFNAFRWDTTSQGHNYWYSIEAKWLLYIYDNLDLIDESDKQKLCVNDSKMLDAMSDILKYYTIEDIDYTKIDGYNELLSLFNAINTTSVDISQ